MKVHVFLGLAALLLAAQAGRASDPIAIYALVDKVEVEPSEGQAERLRLTGTFCLAIGRSGEEYAPPTRGFLYFTLPSNKSEVYRKEWNDLKKVAGTGQVVGFGGRYNLKAKVRNDKDVAKDPFPYPAGVGLTKVPRTNPQARQLLEFKAKP